ncbi:hypothetical protein HDU97_009526 [Phlyctochytrium planicorne]|nr:hypothetical protein HDU97_009526 [Phlyctochytrium planicorne]
MKALSLCILLAAAAATIIEAAPKRQAHAIKSNQHSSSDTVDASEGWWDDMWGNSNSGSPSHWWDGIYGGNNQTPAPRQPKTKEPNHKTLAGSDKKCGPSVTQSVEGLCTKCYLDQLGIPTIGVGLNLEVPGNRRLLEKHGAVFDDIETQRRICRKGRGHCTREACAPGERNCLSAETLQNVFDKVTWPSMLANADRFVPNLPPNVRNAMADMSMMGFASLSKFKKLRKALQERDFARAAAEVKDSKWCRQTGNRCKTTSACVASGV